LILPVAVILKRFFTPLLVLSLGILVSFVESVSSRHGSPIGQPAYSEGARLTGFAPDCKLNAGNVARTLKSLQQMTKIAGWEAVLRIDLAFAF
jgi:hypothetical protein